MPSAVIDSNLLVLLTVGSLNKNLIREHKRTTQFTIEDFDLLTRLLAEFETVFVTPNSLTETSNLVQQIKEPYRSHLLSALGLLIDRLQENHVPSSSVANSQIFIRLDLADAALAEGFPDAYVLTDDFNLYYHLASVGRQVVNFNHYRTGAWGLGDI